MLVLHLAQIKQKQAFKKEQTLNELWADIRSYEGRYQISNAGRVKSLERFRKGKSNSLVKVPEKIMRLYVKKESARTKPYVQIAFRGGGIRTIRGKAFLVHRLVADAFIKPLEQGEQVDHINGVHWDNRVVNLRVMKMREHALLHPRVVTPGPRNVTTGRFI